MTSHPTDPRPKRTADVVGEALHAHGVRYAFGMPGGEVVTLLDGLERAGIAFRLARHETAAALMAAGASLGTGMPAVLLTTLGPGLANAVNGIADAAQERIPLIVLSGVIDPDQRGRYTHQVIDHAAMLRPLVKASFEIEAGTAAETIHAAVALALSHPMGPVHLDLAPAVAAAAAPPVSTERPVAVTDRPPVPAGALDALRQRINMASRPLILAGFEAAREGAGPAIEALAAQIGAPVVTTYKGKGLIPEDHPLALGAAGLSPKADALLLGLFRAADLVLAIGYDPIEMRAGWRDMATSATLVEITAHAHDHGMHRSGLQVEASPLAVVPRLLDGLRRHAGWPDGRPAAIRDDLRRAFAASGEWGPSSIVSTLQESVLPEDIVTVDSGAHRILLSQQWVCKRPLTLLQSAGFCTMAAALPLAIGVATAKRGPRVHAVMGDGGLEMGVGELATLRDLGLPVTVVVFQDRSLALIAMKQSSAGLPPAGVALGETDFARVAEGFGGHGTTVETIDDFRNALQAARRRTGFSLIACRFDARLYDGSF